MAEHGPISDRRRNPVHTRYDTAQANPRVRVDVQLHDLLVKNPSKNLLLPARAAPTSLPDPIYPQHAELQNMPDPDTFPDNRKWTAPLVYRAMRGWLLPYFRSRTLPGDFHPIIAYLFTEWKCNLDCWYCWALDNKVKGMTEDTRGEPSTGCTTAAAAC